MKTMQERFDIQFDDYNPRVGGFMPLYLTTQKYDEIKAFISSEIEMAKREERSKIVKQIQKTDFWKSCEDYFTPDQREYLLTIITKHHGDKYITVGGGLVKKGEYGTLEEYTHQDNDFSKMCSFKYCRCKD